MPHLDCDQQPEGWRPRYPDPALVDPDRPGLRAHRYPPNQLHGWVFGQREVWVDFYGNEIEIGTTGSMSDAYVANVLAFARGQADRIREMVVLDLLIDLLLGQLERLHAEEAHLDLHVLRDACSAYEIDADAWLERTPLIQELKRRLEERP